MAIRFVEHQELDKIKWNSCVHYATNSSVFGYMWYLNATAPQWDALVEDDYKSVMPLPYENLRFRRGKKLVQPELIRELAIYSVDSPSAKRTDAFWTAIAETFRKANLEVDAFSQPSEHSFLGAEKQNYFLPLASTYETIRSKYDPKLIEILEMAHESGIVATSSRKPEAVAESYRLAHQPVKEQVFHGLQRVMYNALHRGWGFASGVMTPQQDILASDFFIHSNGRIMSLANAHGKDKLSVAARAYMLDALIQNNSSKPVSIDFNTQFGNEDIPKMFGAISYGYRVVKL